MALSDTLDLGKLLARAAEPDMHVGILHPDLLGEFSHFHSGITGGLEGGEDLFLEQAAGSALAGTSGLLGWTASFLLRGATGLLGFGGAATAFSGGADSLAGEERGELGLDLFNLVEQAFLALGELDEVAQGAGINVC